MSYTPYVEANALLAVIEDDLDTARAVIAGMLPGERRALIAQAHQLADLCQEHDRIRAAAGGPCYWRYCGQPSSGYIFIRNTPRGICRGHRAEVVDHDHTVYEPPTEVTL